MATNVMMPGDSASVVQTTVVAGAQSPGESGSVVEGPNRASVAQDNSAISVRQTRNAVGARNSGGYSSDYNVLRNKPSIESTVLIGNRTLEDFGIGLSAYQSIYQLFD